MRGPEWYNRNDGALKAILWQDIVMVPDEIGGGGSSNDDDDDDNEVNGEEWEDMIEFIMELLFVESPVSSWLGDGVQFWNEPVALGK